MTAFFIYYYFTINLLASWGLLATFALFSTFHRAGEIFSLEEQIPYSIDSDLPIEPSVKLSNASFSWNSN